MADIVGGQQGTAVVLEVDCQIYSREAVLRAGHVASAKCYVALKPASENHILVELTPRDEVAVISDLVGAFWNDLLNQQVREDVERETRTIRELIVTQAFAEADFDTTVAPQSPDTI